MSIAESMLPEFDQEMASTRKTLERVPDDKFAFKPHEKSGALGWLAGHVAMMPIWLTTTIKQDSLDIAPVGREPVKLPEVKNRQDLLDVFDKSVAEARPALAGISDEDLMKPWSLLQGGQPIFTMPRISVIRSVVLNHMIHHRGQLTVYLRLNDIPVPGLYGPSADETAAGWS